jgi:hypothetical protein
VSSPTQRSLKYLRTLGYSAAVVEHWNMFARIRQDLFGWIDIVAVHVEGRIVGVQTTSAPNAAARVKKAKGNEALFNWISAGGELHVHGWKKVKNRWALTVQKSLTLEDVRE